jgi:hypothetical protein
MRIRGSGRHTPVRVTAILPDGVADFDGNGRFFKCGIFEITAPCISRAQSLRHLLGQIWLGNGIESNESKDPTEVIEKLDQQGHEQRVPYEKREWECDRIGCYSD